MRETSTQIVIIGIETLPIICLCLFVLSLMLQIEFSYHMKLILKQDNLVPAYSTLMMVRELGPVVTALLLASRAGASMAAEISTMKMTGQIDALRMCGIDPIDYLVLPRCLASVISGLALLSFAFAVAIIGVGFIYIKLHPITPNLSVFFLHTPLSEFARAYIKAACFSSVIPLIAVNQGFSADQTAQGVGYAATYGVVNSFITIIILDFILTYCLYAI